MKRKLKHLSEWRNKVTTVSFTFKLIFVIFGIFNLIMNIISTIFSIRKWNKTMFSDYIKVRTVDIIISVLLANIFIHAFGLFVIIKRLNRILLIIFLIGIIVINCLSFAVVWINFSNRDGLLAALYKKYISFTDNLELTTFENKMKCCGWEFVLSTCSNNFTSFCSSAISAIIEEAGNYTGNYFIGCTIVQLTQILFLIFILVCYSGFDWKKIKPIIDIKDIPEKQQLMV